MCPVGYYTMIRSKNHIYDLRLSMVRYASKHGIRQTAIHFRCSRNTVRRLLVHIRELGIDLSEVDVQTDNGGEFDGNVRTEKDRGFVHTIEKIMEATHTYIPPGCKNANADVESVHATTETDFFDVERFSSRADFFAKITTYQLYYNLAHRISTRADRSPFEILRNRDPTLDPRLFMLLPCDLDRTLRHAHLGHDVPGLTAGGGGGTGGSWAEG